MSNSRDEAGRASLRWVTEAFNEQEQQCRSPGQRDPLESKSGVEVDNVAQPFPI